MKQLVVAKDVKKSFQHMGRTLDVLRGIDLVINEGEMIGIVGQSGAGKSTLLHCFGTLDVITSGSMQIGGEELTTMSGARLADLRNRTIGFVFQFHHLLPEFNALENVVMPGLIQGKSRKEMEPRASATRCCSPPESSPGRWCARSRKPTSSSKASARVSRAPRGRP